jgi:uncharacterized protein YkwD
VLKLIVIVALSGVVQSSISTHVLEGLRRHGYPRVVMDESIGKASQSLAKLLALSSRNAHEKEINAHLGVLLKRHGVSDATYWTSIVRGPAVAGHHVLKDILPKLNRTFKPSHLGIGQYQAGGDRFVVSIFVHRAGDLSFEDRGVMTQGTRRIKGTLTAGYFQPRIIVETADGKMTAHHPDLDQERRFEVLVQDASESSNVKVELVAEHVSGPRVLNLVETAVEKGSLVLPVIRMERSSGLTHDRALHLRINQIRMHQGLPNLVWETGLASVAETHAGFISKHRVLTHKAQTHGHLRQRLSAQSMRPSYMAELLVSAESPLEALEAIKTSPAHFQQIGDGGINSIGIGVRDGYYVIILARFEAVKSEVD